MILMENYDNIDFNSNIKNKILKYVIQKLSRKVNLILKYFILIKNFHMN